MGRFDLESRARRWPRSAGSWILIVLVVTLAHGETETSTQAAAEETTEQAVRAVYADSIQAIATRRAALQKLWQEAANDAEREAVVADAQREIASAVETSLAPFWYGTPWAFEGTSETPGVGEIACGYFVSTLLRDAGFKVERVRMAQQPAELIIKSLAAPDQIRRFRRRLSEMR